MLVYAFGSLIIFILLGFTHKLQQHLKLTETEDDQLQFIQSKKLLALLLFTGFIIVGIYDIKTLFETGVYHPSFHTFYTILIFSDIIIVLTALRYTLNYYKIYRYSAFVLATIFIRIALSIDYYANVIIGIATAVFILLLTWAYNYFLKDFTNKNLQ